MVVAAVVIHVIKDNEIKIIDDVNKSIKIGSYRKLSGRVRRVKPFQQKQNVLENWLDNKK